MKVSAVITTYGRGFDVLSRSINSVLNQSYTDIELILVDDNGLNTPLQKEIESKIKLYENVKYIINNTNKGAQESRNSGIANSNGDCIAFLDDDDEWEYNKIEEQIKYVKPDVGLVYSLGKTVNEDSNTVIDYTEPNQFRETITFEDLLFSDFVGTTSQALIPKYVFNEVGLFDVSQKARQDYEMWLRISKKYKCVGVKKSLFKHFVYDGEQISKNKSKCISGLLNIYNKYKDDYKNNATASYHLCYIISKFYFNDFKYFNGFLYFAKAFMHLFKSIVFENRRFQYYVLKR